MVSILEGELAETIADALTEAAIPYDVVVSRTTSVDPGTPWDPSDDTVTVTDYECRGYVDTFDDSYRAGGLVQQGDIKIVILANTLSVTPTLADTVTVRGETYQIVNVSSDPALALWEVQARQ